MKWYEMIWNDMKWYEMLWNVMIWYDSYTNMWYEMAVASDIWHDMLCYNVSDNCNMYACDVKYYDVSDYSLVTTPP